MLKKKLDYTKMMDVAVYLRMSSDQQSSSSPDQQLSEIKSRIDSRNLPWRIVREYRDDAKSGKYVRSRSGFMDMLRDIQNGSIKVGAILVDTIERFGRMDDLDSYRRKLEQRHGVVVLTADRNFADPHSVESRAMQAFENFRAADDGRIKANDVIRGKHEAIRQGYWPGSPVPFGYRLEVVKVEKRKGREIKHHRLVIDDATGPIVRSLFEQSADNPGFGQSRMARWLNNREDISPQLKPFHASTVGKWLSNPIYRGILIWSNYSTGVLDDRRILQKNDDEDVTRVAGFCDPIADKSVLDRVDANISLRQRKRPSNERTKSQTRGINYRYPLTGLVRCGHCGASMVPNSTSNYRLKNGEEKNYCSYLCPNTVSDGCSNSKRVQEDWLRQTIINRIVMRLLPDDRAYEQLIKNVQGLVASEWKRAHQRRFDQTPQLESELLYLKQQVKGWAESLVKSDLHHRLRLALELKTGAAYDRVDEIELLLQVQTARENVLENAVLKSDITSRLNRFHEVVMGDCPTAASLELSMHIDKIECFDDGRVISRICKVGSSPEAVQWIARTVKDDGNESPDVRGTRHRVKPRRRGLLRLNGEIGNDNELQDRVHMATDPNRFAGLPDDWFWVDEDHVPMKTSWVQENASRVLTRYNEIKATGEQPNLKALAREFGKTRPTISRALDIATGQVAGQKPEHRKESNPVKGNPEIETVIAQMHDDGKLNKAIAEALGISRSTVTMALDRLYEQRGLPRPDGRSERHK